MVPPTPLWTDTHAWKQYLPATSLACGNDGRFPLQYNKERKTMVSSSDVELVDIEGDDWAVRDIGLRRFTRVSWRSTLVELGKQL